MIVTLAVIAISLLCSAVASPVTRQPTFAEAYHYALQQDNITSYYIARHINSTADQWDHPYQPITIPESGNGKLHIGYPNQYPADREVGVIEKRIIDDSCTFTVIGYARSNDCIEDESIWPYGFASWVNWTAPCAQWVNYQCRYYGINYFPMRSIQYSTSDLFYTTWNTRRYVQVRTFGYDKTLAELKEEPLDCSTVKVYDKKRADYGAPGPFCVKNNYPHHPLFFPAWGFNEVSIHRPISWFGPSKPWR